jgi:hypothetical protein
MPVLRYFVTQGGGSEPGEGETALEVAQLEPAADATVAAGASLVFRWTEDSRAVHYRLEVEAAPRQALLAAVLPSGTLEYRAPPWLVEKAPSASARWRIVVLDAGGKQVRQTAWRGLRFTKG